MKSMTGYGEACCQDKRVKVAVQLRTLNHRHLDIQLRIPRIYLSMEEGIRRRVRRTVDRGRLEVFITRSPLKGQGRKLEFDEGLMEEYLWALRRAKRTLGLDGEIDLSLLLRLPDLFYFREVDVISGSERGLVLRTLESALKSLEHSREREGRHLEKDIQSQVRQLRGICGRLVAQAQRLQVQLKELDQPPDRARTYEVQREITGAGNTPLKGDINEEVVRLRSHVEGIAVLIGRRGPVGKKFDFLLQEVQRELNTIASKAPQLPVVRLVLSGKEKVEKIREQVQNVE